MPPAAGAAVAAVFAAVVGAVGAAAALTLLDDVPVDAAGAGVALPIDAAGADGALGADWLTVPGAVVPGEGATVGCDAGVVDVVGDVTGVGVEPDFVCFPGFDGEWPPPVEV